MITLSFNIVNTIIVLVLVWYKLTNMNYEYVQSSEFTQITTSTLGDCEAQPQFNTPPNHQLVIKKIETLQVFLLFPSDKSCMLVQ